MLTTQMSSAGEKREFLNEILWW